MNNISARMIYDNAKAALLANGVDAQKAKCTQSFLRLELALQAGKTSYQFQLLSNQTMQGIFATELRLNMQDSFVVSSLGFFLAVPASATDAAFRLLTRASADKFATAGAAAAAEVLYNSSLSLMVNNDNLLPAWDTLRHKVIPQTQYTAAVNSPVDQNDGATSGFYPVEPNITLVGSKNSVLTLNLPAAVATLEPNSRVIVILRGVLAQNTAL